MDISNAKRRPKAPQTRGEMRFAMAPGVVLIPSPDSVPTALGVIRGLGRAGIPVIAIAGPTGGPSLSSRYVSQPLRGPDYRTDATDYIQWLCDLGRGITPKPVLFPTTDEQVALLNIYQEDLAPWYAFTYFPMSCLDTCLDKALTNDAATRVGVPFPATVVFNGDTDIDEAVRIAPVPAVVKPATWVSCTDGGVRRQTEFSTTFGNKAVRTTTQDQLRQTLIRAREKGLKCLIQEEIVGPPDQLYSAGLFVDDQDKVQGTFVGRKLRQFPCDFGSGSLCEGGGPQELIDASAALLEDVGFRGIAEVEWKLDPHTGTGQLLEINPRPWVWFSTSLMCNVNLAHIAHSYLSDGERVSYDQHETPAKWIDVIKDFDYFRAYRNGDEWDTKMSFADYMRSIRGPKEHAFFAADDPRPGFARLRNELSTRVAALPNRMRRRADR